MYNPNSRDASSSAQNSRNARPLSFIPSPRGEVIDTPPAVSRKLSAAKPYLGPRFHNPFQDDDIQKLSAASRSMTAPVAGPVLGSYDGDDWDSRQNRGERTLNSYMEHDSDDESQPFALGEIDVDTSPDAVAREFSHLQALRRMSMDVNMQDPDLPAFGIPAVAPANDVDDNDPSRMYWVPARLHPELAPKEFKSFIQEKVKTIKRSSLSTSLSDEMPLQSGQGSLRRRKSMLSRQIDNGHGYQDGATRLQRKRSESENTEPEVNLQELEQIMSDPSQGARRISMETMAMENQPDRSVVQDMDVPMLPRQPPGSTLKRSTRTQYRKGSLRKNPLLARRQTLKDDDERSNSPSSLHEVQVPPLPNVPVSVSVSVSDMSELSDFADAAFGLSRVHTEPIQSTGQKTVENFSRPGRRGAPSNSISQPSSSPAEEALAVQKPELRSGRAPADDQAKYGNGRLTTGAPKLPIPQIIEPSPEPYSPQSQDGRPMSAPVIAPQRTSSIDQPSAPPQTPLPNRPIGQRTAIRPQSLPHRKPTNHRAQNITLDDIAASTIVGSRNEAIILASGAEEVGKKGDKKFKHKDESRKTSWGWFSGGDKEEKEQTKKNKLKSQKTVDKSHDGARLDVLQGAIEGSQQKTRESTIFDRQSIHIEEDNKKVQKKGSNDQKKEKGGLFSSVFGGNKKKGDKDGASTKKHSASSLRGLSPDPPKRASRPDIDYPWTRFSITEERAIYRMAHIKLANPRRELYSQVLLSNFMYSYLAKVQQMHPHVQIPQSAAAKQAQRQERQQQQKQAEAERKQERQDKLKEQEAQKQMRLSQREGRQDEHSQQQQYNEVCIPGFKFHHFLAEPGGLFTRTSS
jgi:hypothetical protein